MTVVKVYLAGEEYEMNATEGAESADGKPILAAVDLSQMKKKDDDGKEGAFELLTQAAVINTMSKTNLQQQKEDKDKPCSDPDRPEYLGKHVCGCGWFGVYGHAHTRMYTHAHSLSHSGYIMCFHISKIIYITACDIFCPMHSGNSTECGLLKMANILGNEGKPIDYKCKDESNWMYKKIRATYPENAEGYKQNSFSSTRKRMSTRVMLAPGKCLNTQLQMHISDTHTHTHTHTNTHCLR
jgi:hypothetical protein